jgi:hypothetical protein
MGKSIPVANVKAAINEKVDEFRDVAKGIGVDPGRISPTGLKDDYYAQIKLDETTIGCSYGDGRFELTKAVSKSLGYDEKKRYEPGEKVPENVIAKSIKYYLK